MEITLVKKGERFYARLALTEAVILPPALFLLKASTRKEAHKAIAVLRVIQNALDDYGRGEPYPYGLPPELADELPAYAHYVWRDGAKALEAMRQNN
jgi:hypothetical protein